MKKQKIKQTKVVINSKIKNWLLRHTITVFSCVLIIALGITALTYADPVTTTIGENISTNDLSVAGNITSGTWQGSEIQDAYIADDITASNYLPLTGGDLTGDLSTTGSITGGTWQGTPITTQYGGTGQDWSAITQGNIPYFSDTGTLSNLAPGTTGQFLSQGSDGNPTWDNVTRSATFVVCANDSLNKTQCDYVCDGVDDQVEIQAAIDALTPNRTHQEKIVCIGNFSCSDSIHIDSFTIFELQGKITLSDDYSSSDDAFLSLPYPCQLSEIRGGILDGNNKSSIGFADYGGYYIHPEALMGDPLNRVYNLNVRNFNGTGFYCAGRRALYVGCTAFQNKEWGFYTDSLNGAQGTDNTFINCGTVQNGEQGVAGGGWLINGAWNHLFRCYTDHDYRRGMHVGHSNLVMYGGYIEWSDGTGMVIETASDNHIFNGVKFIACDYSAVESSGSNAHFTCCQFYKIGVMDYGIRLYANADATHIENCVFSSDVGYPVVDGGTNTTIFNNIGFTTENSGTATLATGTTSIAVNHELDVTPSVGDIVVTPAETWGNMTKFWIGNYTSTQFTIYADQNPGQDVDFAWKAIVL